MGYPSNGSVPATHAPVAGGQSVAPAANRNFVPMGATSGMGATGVQGNAARGMPGIRHVMNGMPQTSSASMNGNDIAGMAQVPQGLNVHASQFRMHTQHVPFIPAPVQQIASSHANKVSALLSLDSSDSYMLQGSVGGAIPAICPTHASRNRCIGLQLAGSRLDVYYAASCRVPCSIPDD